MPATPKTKASSRGRARAARSAGCTVASGPKTRIMIASIISPKASMPDSTDGLKIPNVRSAIPKTRATTKVLRIPLVRLLINRLMQHDDTDDEERAGGRPQDSRQSFRRAATRSALLVLLDHRVRGCRRGTPPCSRVASRRR